MTEATAVAAVTQDFTDGYALGFSAAKHPFHMPAVEEAWINRDDIRARGHLPPVTEQRASAPVVSGEGELAYEREYFERGFIAAAAWSLTKREPDTLSDAVIDHAWAHRDEGMDAEDILPVRALPTERGQTDAGEVGHG